MENAALPRGVFIGGKATMSVLDLLSSSLALAQDRKKPPPRDQPKVLVALPFGVKPGPRIGW